VGGGGKEKKGKEPFALESREMAKTLHCRNSPGRRGIPEKSQERKTKKKRVKINMVDGSKTLKKTHNFDHRVRE